MLWVCCLMIWFVWTPLFKVLMPSGCNFFVTFHNCSSFCFCIFLVSARRDVTHKRITKKNKEMLAPGFAVQHKRVSS